MVNSFIIRGSQMRTPIILFKNDSTNSVPYHVFMFSNPLLMEFSLYNKLRSINCRCNRLNDNCAVPRIHSNELSI